jgi:hypothetical protein
MSRGRRETWQATNRKRTFEINSFRTISRGIGNPAQAALLHVTRAQTSSLSQQPSSSPRNGPSTRPSTSDTRARVLRSRVSSTCLRSIRPLSQTPLSAWKQMGWRSKLTMPRPSTSTGSPSHGLGPSGPHQPMMPSTQQCGRRLSPRC